MNTASAARALLSDKSSYLSHLRRAFLLRAHPDRFRSHPESLRKVQAAAIGAFQDRISASDFLAYKSNRNGHGNRNGRDYNYLQSSKWKKYDVYLERKDGSIQKHILDLDGSVEIVLKCLAKALKSTGMSMMKEPPASSIHLNHDQSDENEEGFTKPNSAVSDFGTFNQHDNISSNTRSSYNHGAFGSSSRFDVNTRRGRDLMHFLSNLDEGEIVKRQASRIDATAAALVARQSYKFQAIDGTGLGWSSASLAKCLLSLTKLYDEHSGKFNVSSFYPFRLLLSNDEFQAKVDLYSGTVMLNPNSTQIQWLDTLVSVTEEAKEILEENRCTLRDNQSFVQNALNVSMKKGHSCSSHEYHHFLAEISNSLSVHDNRTDDESSSELALGRVVAVVETAQAGRRAMVTKEGQIRISTGMSAKDISKSVQSLRQVARERVETENNKLKRIKELISLVRHDLSVSKISKARFAAITNEQFIDSLTALLNLEDETKVTMREYLVDKSLVVTGSRRTCHLIDDGSIVIPFDWR